MFQLEKEMIPILKRDLQKIFGSTHAAEEFVSGNGRPDLVFACASAIGSFWKETPPDYETLHLLIKYLNKEGRILHVDEVLGVDSNSRKKVQIIIDTLKELGFIEYKDENHLIVRRKYQPVAEEFVSIEAKLSDWKSGVYQAVRYKAFSNSSYLAISEQYLEKVDRNFLREHGVGLITVSDTGATIVVRAKKNKPSSVVSHCYLTERLISTYSCSQENF
jgi:ribosomal protein S18